MKLFRRKKTPGTTIYVVTVDGVLHSVQIPKGFKLEVLEQGNRLEPVLSKETVSLTEAIAQGGVEVTA